ncbi:UvrD-helicase domain-containing protein [Sedimentibacter hydroxybenzoicus DSM 7310]|uniref:DNA 3'-5' helicase n=1 Tax=Sedimentibacter hydroxybenzoicus DSM 7310 TaxID=1123245 RepID=A0A974BKN6_SEDHY|nr:UvrD-helicase domain-containing protein [Sedimentibacter hydroxybenzoicus]NYB75074.1 UvrD-helicase domain-containing protein [Sedimentibacter hydroxybenzoicus DSM 7310]
MDLLQSLNEKQREAASHDKGPILVIAGAGTGKTRVLTHRIAYLIDTNRAMPWEVLAITFTNKAANEMKERIGQLLDYPIDRMWIGTFHSICVRILRKNIERIGYDSNFVIYDTNDTKIVIKDCIKELNLDTKKYNVNSIKSIISSEKNRRNSADDYIKEHFNEFYKRNVGEVYALYEKKLKIANALDFDDLILKTIILLENEQDVREYYQERFKYILVDEYQDTNLVQYSLVKILGKKPDGENNVFVVGDEDQSIYGWRGADINNILNFEKDFEGAKVVKLEKNYRSTNVILNAANGVIQNNCQRKGKNLYTDFEGGNLIRVLEMDNEKDEAFTVSCLIRKEIRENNASYSDMAVLYRTNAQSRALEEGLIREGIPYRIVGGLKFYERKEIKDIMAYLMLTFNQKDNISFDRIINVPRRKIGQKTIDLITEYADRKGISKFDSCYELDGIGLTNSASKSVSDFISMMEMLMIKKDVMPVSEFISDVFEVTGYKSMLLEDETVEGRSRLENIDEFLSAAKDFEERYEDNGLEDFLSHVSLLADIDKTDETKNNCVTLMTVHSAKGLEYDTVFVTGLEDGIFPIIHQEPDSDDEEEERRLFYVAITRAKRMLFITYANDRMRFGNHETKLKSRFLKEIPAECVEDTNPMAYAAKKIEGLDKNIKKMPSFVKSNFFKGSLDVEKEKPKLKSDKIVAGDKVMHKSWGVGTVVQIKDDGDSKTVVIAFESKGIKNLNLEYAPIEKI